MSLRGGQKHGLDHIGYIAPNYIPTREKKEEGEEESGSKERNDARFYYLKDHLGNVKVTVNSLGAVAAYDDFDPYGMGLDGRSGVVGEADARYKFTGKERDVETGYDCFGARYYEARRKPTARTRKT